MHTDKPGHGRTRFVATCQQLLVLGAVFAALIPAATLVSLDVVRPDRAGSQPIGSAERAGALSAYVTAATTPSTVPTAPVQAKVKEIALTTKGSAAPSARRPVTGSVGGYGAGPAKVGEPTAEASVGSAPGNPNATVVTSTPQPVTGFGTVGVTWAHGENIPAADLDAQVRTEKDGTWSVWKKLDYDDDGPDADSTEGKATRPGTMEALVGHVDQVQVRLAVTGANVPTDLKLAVIDPGKPTSTASEKAAIDTGKGDDTSASATASGEPSTTSAGSSALETTSASTTSTGNSEAQAVLAAAAYTPKPQIYSRAQWGANESIREQTAPSYGIVEGGFVHHTVNANDYTKAEVPGIIRSIYAYHVESRGWRDIGYNFLIDKFGRIWEGRAGGVDRPVVGAHTENYNNYGFGASAIGNYDIAQPSSAMIQAYGALFAWKLSLHGVAANATNVRIGPKVFPHAIEGHRDTKATACPGKYLYAKIPEIRTIAASLQKGWSGRELGSNLAATKYPDLVARQHSNGQVFIIPTGGLAGWQAGRTITTAPTSTKLVLSPDLTGDGRADLVSIAANGASTTRPGEGGGRFGAAVKQMPSAFTGKTLVTAVGDLNGDHRNDFVARTASGALAYYLGGGHGGFAAHVQTGRSLAGFTQLAAVGDLDGDHHVDLVGLKGGRLYRFRGVGDGRFYAPTAVAATGSPWSDYKDITGYGDFDNDGHDDLFARGVSGRGWIFPGNGHGGFKRPIGPFSSMQHASSVIGAAQLTGNLLPDLLVRTGTTISLVPNDGRRDLAPRIYTGLTLPRATQILNAGDWDRDGKGDLIARNSNGHLYLYPGKGNGTFGSPVDLGGGFGSVSLLQVVGDVTGDGWPDLQGQRGNVLYIWPGRGRSGHAAGFRSHAAISASAQIAAGRWTADGAPDSIFRANNRLTLYAGNGPGGLTSARSLGVNVSRYNLIFGVGDLGGGSSSDLIAREKKTSALYALQRTPTGGLAQPLYLGSAAGYDLID